MTGLIVAKVTLVLGVAWLALSVMRRSSPSMRHVVAVTALAAALTIPALELVLPSWRVLPRAETVGTIAATSERLARPAPAGVTHVEAPIAAANTGQIGLDQLVFLAWGIGSVALLMLLLGQMAAMHRVVRRAETLADPAWKRMVSETCRGLEIDEYVEVKLRPARTMPAVWGFKRPVILLPRDCLAWSDERRRAVLTHELAHIARRDTLTLVIGQLACALHWFNPLVWLLRNRLAAEREFACDDLALRQGIPPSCYADHLLATVAGYRQQRTFAPVMAARSRLEERIMAIIDMNRSRRNVRASTQFAFAAIVASALAPLSSLSWAENQDSSHEASARTVVESDSATFGQHLRALGIQENDSDALVAGLSARSPLTRASSAWALGSVDDPMIVDPLLQAGYDADARVRQWAVRSLARWDAPRVADMLVVRLDDGDAEVRQWAVRTLDGRDVPIDGLINKLDDPDAEVREWAARALADSDDEDARLALAGRLQAESDPAVTEWLIRSIDVNADPGSAEHMLAALSNESAEVRQWAVRGLVDKRDDRTTESLIAMLQDDDAEVREWSARSLGYCGNERAVGALQALDDDPDEDVREWAIRALDEIECS